MAKIIHFPTPDSDLLLLHIELKEITPKIWRRFAVPANITLVKLHRVIQDVMGWSDSHLHEFEIAGERYGTPDPDGWGRQVTPEARKTLTKVLMESGRSLMSTTSATAGSRISRSKKRCLRTPALKYRTALKVPMLVHPKT